MQSGLTLIVTHGEPCETVAGRHLTTLPLRQVGFEDGGGHTETYGGEHERDAGIGGRTVLAAYWEWQPRRPPICNRAGFAKRRHVRLHSCFDMRVVVSQPFMHP
jgi:hypothetical protein